MSRHEGDLPAPTGGGAVDAFLPKRGATAGRITLDLPAETRSCAHARQAVRAFCRTQGLPAIADDAELLTSELVGNAVEHSGTAITLTAECTGDVLTVRVRDDNSKRVSHAVGRPDELAECGRGLVVVDQLAADWGTERLGTGKSVWFRLS